MTHHSFAYLKQLCTVKNERQKKKKETIVKVISVFIKMSVYMQCILRNSRSIGVVMLLVTKIFGIIVCTIESIATVHVL